MSYKKKSWKEKLQNNKSLPKVVKITPNQEKTWGKGTIAIPSPIEVYQIIRKIPKRKLITINQIRKKVAEKHKATVGCPICCGLFANIAAHAAVEEKGKTPWWRTLKGDGELNPKYPPGQKELLEKEGYKIIKKGKKLVVEDYEKKLVNIHI